MPSSRLSITLTFVLILMAVGAATLSAQVTASPTSVNFGNVAVGTLSTPQIAGGNGRGYSGDGGPATNAKLFYPTTVRLDGAGNIYFTDDGNNAVRTINPAGTFL